MAGDNGLLTALAWPTTYPDGASATISQYLGDSVTHKAAFVAKGAGFKTRYRYMIVGKYCRNSHSGATRRRSDAEERTAKERAAKKHKNVGLK